MYETKRLRLCAVSKADIEEVSKFYNDYELQRCTHSSTSTLLPADIEDLDKWLRTENENFKMVVKDKETNEVIGYFSVVVEYLPRVGFPYLFLKKEERGKGLGKELMNEIVRLCFEELNTRQIALSVYSFNLVAQKVYRSIGFIEEGRLRQKIYRSGEYHDIIQMALFKDKWLRFKTKGV